MRKLWARVGVEITLTDQEYENFIKKANGNFAEREESEEMFLRFLKSKEKICLNGESYFPDKVYCGQNDNPEDSEISYEF